MLDVRRAILVGLIVSALGAGFVLSAHPDGPRDIRAFDPQRLAELELEMWQAYYRADRVRLVRGLVTTLREQYHCSYASALRAGLRFGRAASTFSGIRDGYDRVLPDLEAGYAIVGDCAGATFDPTAVARAELTWWVARRVPGQQSPENVGRLIAEANALIFGLPAAQVLEASVLRAEAGRLRDEGGARADWVAVAGLLRRSYRALHGAVRPPPATNVVFRTMRCTQAHQYM
jgi:hypothetical protein